MPGTTSEEVVPWTTNDGVVLGILCVILFLVFRTSTRPLPFFRHFYRIVPPLLLCYFLPSILTWAGVWDPDRSQLYHICSRYLLPASLVLLTLNLKLREILRLGPKAVCVFLSGTTGVVLGGAVSLMYMRTYYWSPGDPKLEEAWRGMATVAGSWIGGGANQAAMNEVFGVDADTYAIMIAVDVLVASVWMAVLLLCIPHTERIDRWIGVDPAWFGKLKAKMSARVEEGTGPPRVVDLFALLAVGFGVTGLAHCLADAMVPWLQAHAPGLDRFSLTKPFFWLVVIATTSGIALSFTPASRLENAGASRLGTVFLYLLVASIGMKMDIRAVHQAPDYFVMGGIWILVHGIFIVGVGVAIRAPLFLMAVGSQANIGGAASAPVVAGSFHPSLAPVGVLLAVLGYAVGTYAAYGCAQLMRIISQSGAAVP